MGEVIHYKSVAGNIIEMMLEGIELDEHTEKKFEKLREWNDVETGHR